MERAGEKNAYYCGTCRGYIVTVNLDDGTTPFMLACRVAGEPSDALNLCDGRMKSMFYPAAPWPERDGFGTLIPTEPTHEWYAPKGAELKRIRRSDPQTAEHVRRGGLLLRRVDAR